MLMTVARLIRFGLEVIAAEPLRVFWSALVHGTIWVEILSVAAAFVLLALFRSPARSGGLRSAPQLPHDGVRSLPGVSVRAIKLG